MMMLRSLSSSSRKLTLPPKVSFSSALPLVTESDTGAGAKVMGGIGVDGVEHQQVSADSSPTSKEARNLSRSIVSTFLTATKHSAAKRNSEVFGNAEGRLRRMSFLLNCAIWVSGWGSVACSMVSVEAYYKYSDIPEASRAGCIVGDLFSAISTGLTVVLLLSIYLRYVVYMRLTKARNPPGSTPWNHPHYRFWLLIELTLCAIHSPVGVSTFWNAVVSSPRYEIPQRVEGFLTFLSALCRLYLPVPVLEALLGYSDGKLRVIGNMNGAPFNTRFFVRVILNEMPIQTIFVGFLVVVCALSYGVFQFERDTCGPLSELEILGDPHCTQSAGSLNKYSNAVWLGFVTALTIGYGDLVPLTTLGRICSILVGLVGLFVIALLVQTLTRAVDLNKSQENTLHAYRLQVSQLKHHRYAAQLIVAVFRYTSELRKRRESGAASSCCAGERLRTLKATLCMALFRWRAISHTVRALLLDRDKEQEVMRHMNALSEKLNVIWEVVDDVQEFLLETSRQRALSPGALVGGSPAPAMASPPTQRNLEEVHPSFRGYVVSAYSESIRSQRLGKVVPRAVRRFSQVTLSGHAFKAASSELAVTVDGQGNAGDEEGALQNQQRSSFADPPAQRPPSLPEPPVVFFSVEDALRSPSVVGASPFSSPSASAASAFSSPSAVSTTEATTTSSTSTTTTSPSASQSVLRDSGYSSKSLNTSSTTSLFTTTQTSASSSILASSASQSIVRDEAKSSKSLNSPPSVVTNKNPARKTTTSSSSSGPQWVKAWSKGSL